MLVGLKPTRAFAYWLNMLAIVGVTQGRRIGRGSQKKPIATLRLLNYNFGVSEERVRQEELDKELAKKARESRVRRLSQLEMRGKAGRQARWVAKQRVHRAKNLAESRSNPPWAIWYLRGLSPSENLGWHSPASAFGKGSQKGGEQMKKEYTATIDKRGKWYIGYIEDMPGVNTQG